MEPGSRWGAQGARNRAGEQACHGDGAPGRAEDDKALKVDGMMVAQHERT